MVCFRVPGAPAKYRLGNECETYGEVGLAQRFGDQRRYVSINGRLGLVTPGQNDFRRLQLSDREHYLETGGLLDGLWNGRLEGMKLWVGKRFYQRHDIYINDYYYWDNSGTGFGFEEMPLLGGRLAYAMRPHVIEDPDAHTTLRLFKQDPLAKAPKNEAAGPRQERALRSHDLRWRVPANRNGQLTFGLEYRQAHRKGGEGVLLTALHEQEPFLGGFNRLALFYGHQGPPPSYYFTNQERDLANAMTYRLADVLLAQVARRVAMMTALILEHRSADRSADPISGWLSCGVRPQYAFTEHIALAVEYGHDVVNPRSGGARHLDKITIAPQWTARSGFLDRPVVRLFMTWANWNKAADRAGIMAVDDPFSATHGMIFGVQYETWW